MTGHMFQGRLLRHNCARCGWLVVFYTIFLHLVIKVVKTSVHIDIAMKPITFVS